MTENTDITNDPDAVPQLQDDQAHTVTTPLGILKIWFLEEGGNVVQGDADAVDYLNDALLEFTGRYGQALRLDGIDPMELEDYFDGAQRHITVIPPFEALMDAGAKEDSQEDGVALDSATAHLRARFDSLDSLVEHLASEGHGHFVPRTNGMRARCGVDRMCSQCRMEKAVLQEMGYAFQAEGEMA